MPPLTTTTTYEMKKYLKRLSSGGDNRTNAGYVHSIISKALSDPSVFTGFDELKMMVEESISSSTNSTNTITNSSDTNMTLMNTLDLFSYGTIQDYMMALQSDNLSGSADKYMTLTDGQILKLKALSIVSAINTYCELFKQGNEKDQGDSTASTNKITDYSSKTRSRRIRTQGANVHSTSSIPAAVSHTGSCRMIPYSHFQKVIFSSTPSTSSSSQTNLRELEDLLIYCMDSNLLPNGSKLDQKHMCLEINFLPSTTSSTTSHNTNHHILSRDVPMDTLPQLMEQMRAFLKYGLDAKVNLEQCVQSIKHHSRMEEKEWVCHSQVVNVSKNLVSSGMYKNASMVYCEDEEEGGGVHGHDEKVEEEEEEEENALNTIKQSTGWSDDIMGFMRQGKRSKGGPK
jgi:hypothetical protein